MEYRYGVDLNMDQNQILYGVIHKSSGSPSPTPVNGQLYFDTNSRQPYFYSSVDAAWFPMAASSINWSTLLGGVNTSQQFVVSGTSVIATSGGGIIDANRFKGNSVIALADGGTNRSSYPVGSIPYGSSTELAPMTGSGLLQLMDGLPPTVLSYGVSGSIIISNGNQWLASGIHLDTFVLKYPTASSANNIYPLGNVPGITIHRNTSNTFDPFRIRTSGSTSDGFIMTADYLGNLGLGGTTLTFDDNTNSVPLGTTLPRITAYRSNTADGGGIIMGSYATGVGGLLQIWGSGSGAPGGAISTHAGGGAINTRGLGYMEFGTTGNRTVVSGNATANRLLNLPDKNGTLAVLTDIPGGGGAPCPTGAEYIVGALHADLAAERLVTNTSTIVWDLATPGQASVNIIDGSVTLTKIANAAASSILLGRGSAGVLGSYQELTLGTSLAMNGTLLNVVNVAPTSAEYLVGIASSDLASERVVTDTPTVSWALNIGGQAKANVVDDSITFAKIQNATASSVLVGRGSLGALGDYQEITLGNNLYMSGTVLSTTGPSTALTDVVITSNLVLSLSSGSSFYRVSTTGTNTQVSLVGVTGVDLYPGRQVNIINTGTKGIAVIHKATGYQDLNGTTIFNPELEVTVGMMPNVIYSYIYDGNRWNWTAGHPSYHQNIHFTYEVYEEFDYPANTTSRGPHYKQNVNSPAYIENIQSDERVGVVLIRIPAAATSSGVVSALFLGSGYWLPTCSMSAHASIRPRQTGSASAVGPIRHKTLFGLPSTTGTALSTGPIIIYDAVQQTGWRCIFSSGGVAVASGDGPTVISGMWYDLRIDYDPFNRITNFKINNVNYLTVSGHIIPTGTPLIYPLVTYQRLAGTGVGGGTDVMDVDYLYASRYHTHSRHYS